MNSKIRNFQYRVACVAVILLAAAMRVAPMFTSLPYIDYIDEGYVLHQATTMLNDGTIHPRWHGYPNLPAYLTTAAVLAYAPVYRSLNGNSLQSDLPLNKDLHTPEGDNYDLIAPPALIVAGRLVTLCLSLGTVVLTGLVARNLINKRAALLAMLLAALCPALVTRSSNVIVDTFATFFALLSFYFCTRIQDKFESRVIVFAACAGISAGLAFASKYTNVLVFGIALVTIASLARSGFLRMKLLGAALSGLILGCAIGSPSAFLKTGEVWQQVKGIAGDYSGIRSSPGYLGQAVDPSEARVAPCSCRLRWIHADAAFQKDA